jgi:hypothetical protein
MINKVFLPEFIGLRRFQMAAVSLCAKNFRLPVKPERF